jgi:nucleoid-associated protein EbfC
MFDKVKALIDMQKKMQDMKRELDGTNFEVQSPDGCLKIVMNGSQEVKEVTITGGLSQIDKAGFEKTIKDTYNMAIKRSHDIAAGKMKDITGGLNLPGLT